MLLLRKIVVQEVLVKADLSQLIGGIHLIGIVWMECDGVELRLWARLQVVLIVKRKVIAVVEIDNAQVGPYEEEPPILIEPTERHINVPVALLLFVLGFALPSVDKLGEKRRYLIDQALILFDRRDNIEVVEVGEEASLHSIERLKLILEYVLVVYRLVRLCF